MNDQTPVTIRKGSEADIPFIAWCNYEASSPAPGFCYWDPLLEGLNTPTMHYIEAMFRAKALAWGDPENFYIAELNGESVAGASGFEMNSEDYRPLRDDRLPEVAHLLGWNEESLTTFRQRYAEVWRDPQDISIAPSAAWTIECVATKPEHRGKGIAKQLLRAILDDGRQHGYTHAGISVTMGNEPAERTYTGIGFQPYVTYFADYFDNQFPGTVKYRISLSDGADETTREWSR